MKLGVISRINKEVLSRAGEVPKWLDALLEPLNEFIEKAGMALQGRLTFEDNFLCKIVSQTFADGVASEINPLNIGQSNLRVTGVIPISAGGLSVNEFGWVQKENGNIGVTFSFVSGSSATCKILILLG